MMKSYAMFVALLLPMPVLAQDRAMQTVWIVQPQSPPQGELILSGGQNILKQRLLPSGLAELVAETAIPETAVSLPAGTQLIEVKSRDMAIFCQTDAKGRGLKSALQYCLTDSDADGRFDGYFRTASATKGLPTIQGYRPKHVKPIDAVGYRRVAPASLRDEYFVAIERRNFFNIYGRESFTIAFGKEGDVDRITAPISFKSSELPKEMNILGARFTALGEENGQMRIRVDATMPMQPFGVVSTTTYRFY